MKNLKKTISDFIVAFLFTTGMAALLISIYSFAEDTREDNGIQQRIERAKTEPEDLRKTVYYTADVSRSDLAEVSTLHESDHLLYESPYKVVYFSDTFKSYDVAWIYTIK